MALTRGPRGTQTRGHEESRPAAVPPPDGGGLRRDGRLEPPAVRRARPARAPGALSRRAARRLVAYGHRTVHPGRRRRGHGVQPGLPGRGRRHRRTGRLPAALAAVLLRRGPGGGARGLRLAAVRRGELRGDLRPRGGRRCGAVVRARAAAVVRAGGRAVLVRRAAGESLVPADRGRSGGGPAGEGGQRARRPGRPLGGPGHTGHRRGPDRRRGHPRCRPAGGPGPRVPADREPVPPTRDRRTAMSESEEVLAPDAEVRQHDWWIDPREYARHEARRGRRFAFTHLAPARTALVVIDMVPFFVSGNPYCRGIVPNIGRIADALRAAGGAGAGGRAAVGGRAPGGGGVFGAATA